MVWEVGDGGDVCGEVDVVCVLEICEVWDVVLCDGEGGEVDGWVVVLDLVDGGVLVGRECECVEDGYYGGCGYCCGDVCVFDVDCWRK